MENPTGMPAEVAAFPLEPGERVISWSFSNERNDLDGYVIRIRREDGYESVHDTYVD